MEKWPNFYLRPLWYDECVRWLCIYTEKKNLFLFFSFWLVQSQYRPLYVSLTILRVHFSISSFNWFIHKNKKYFEMLSVYSMQAYLQWYHKYCEIISAKKKYYPINTENDVWNLCGNTNMEIDKIGMILKLDNDNWSFPRNYSDGRWELKCREFHRFFRAA